MLTVLEAVPFLILLSAGSICLYSFVRFLNYVYNKSLFDFFMKEVSGSTKTSVCSIFVLLGSKSVFNAFIKLGTDTHHYILVQILRTDLRTENTWKDYAYDIGSVVGKLASITNNHSIVNQYSELVKEYSTTNRTSKYLLGFIRNNKKINPKQFIPYLDYMKNDLERKNLYTCLAEDPRSSKFMAML